MKLFRIVASSLQDPCLLALFLTVVSSFDLEIAIIQCLEK